MVSRFVARGAAVIAVLLLAACGPDSAKLSSRKEPAAAPAPFDASDGCAGAAPRLTAAACADPDVLESNAALSKMMRLKSEDLSREGRHLLLLGQAQWFSALRLSCVLRDDEQTMSLEQSACVRLSIFDRFMGLYRAAEAIGPYTFQRIDIFQASPMPAAFAEGGDALMSYVSYPRIDSPDAHEAAFNALAKHALKYAPADETEEIGIYRIAYAGPEIISVQFQKYDMKLGDTEKTLTMEALTVMVKQERRLQAEDVFAPNTAWRDFVAAKAEDGLRAAASQGCFPPNLAAITRDASLRPDRWIISDTGLMIIYPPRSLGPGFQEGCDVEISWKDAAPYLNPKAPAPIIRKSAPPQSLNG